MGGNPILLLDDFCKEYEQIEHSRHRSLVNFRTNVLAGLIAYHLQPEKPSLRLGRDIRLTASVARSGWGKLTTLSDKTQSSQFL